MIDFASSKLTNGELFSAKNKYHVFAVFLQHLYLDPVLAGSKAIELADCSVTHYMRLLTSIESNGQIFHTHLPLEPMLVLASINNLYNPCKLKQLATALWTLNSDLCSAGLIEKGLLGKFAVHTLLQRRIIFQILWNPFAFLIFSMCCLATVHGQVIIKHNLTKPLPVHI